MFLTPAELAAEKSAAAAAAPAASAAAGASGGGGRGTVSAANPSGHELSHALRQ